MRICPCVHEDMSLSVSILLHMCIGAYICVYKSACHVWVWIWVNKCIQNMRTWYKCPCEPLSVCICWWHVSEAIVHVCAWEYMQVCTHPIHISADTPVGLCSGWECLWVCASARQPVKKCACVCARVLHTSRAPRPLISSSLPANPQQTLPAFLGICQLMAGVPLLGNSTPRPLICVP